MKKLPDVGGVDVGHGLFSDAGIAAGSFIAEYVGVLYARRGAPSAYSLFYPCHDGSYEVDAAEYGNVCRFVNHSSTRCNAAYKHVLHQVTCVCAPGRAASRRADQSPHITAPPVTCHVACTCTIWYIQGVVHVVCFAVADIPPEAQVLVNYGASYWHARGIQPVELS